MRPNIDDKDVLFRCKCGHDHFLEVLGDSFEDGCLWLHLIDRPQTFLGAFRRWWKYRSILFADVGLTRDDVKALRETLDEWLERKTNLSDQGEA